MSQRPPADPSGDAPAAAAADGGAPGGVVAASRAAAGDPPDRLLAERRDPIARRRTFAIISHPDAGKTTLTEKLLLYGGAIQLAGAVKARGEQRRARSDWMRIERDRGISVTVSVMTFEYDGCTLNLLDTPGHQDFSEDTYRTLTAVDSAIMVIDAAKGIEEQTRKLFEVCRLRDVPIITFINKLDREAREPLGLLDEIADGLQLHVSPASWPIGMGQRFLGCYDILRDRLVLMPRTKGATVSEGIECQGLGDPKLDELLPEEAAATLREDVELVRGLCPPFDLAAYREGHLTPVFFGSALNTFGIRELLDGLVEYAPSPRPQPAHGGRVVDPHEDAVTGFVFKVQANMDPKHRDRMAFVRLCSGHFRRGMKLTQVRTQKTLGVHNPLLFFAREREIADEAWAGDVIGIPSHGGFAVGDTLTEGENLRFAGIPAFAPEVLRRVRAGDPIRAKHLGRALRDLAEEGAARVFRPAIGSGYIVGVVGPLQFEVLAERIRDEYELPVHFEGVELYTARWLEAAEPEELRRFEREHQESYALDHEDAPVFLPRNAWHLDRTQRDFPKVRFLKVKDQPQ